MATSPTIKILDRPPLPFTIAKSLVRHNVRGGWRLFALLDKFGYLSGKVVKHQLKEGYYILVPAYTSDRFDRADIVGYEQALMGSIVDAASECKGPITIVDCGADIGIVSITVASRLNGVSRVVAFEPNDETFPVLEKNLALLPFQAEAIHSGVSDFVGRGELRKPDYDGSPHACYVEQVPEGGFPVTTVDALSLKAANLFLKIDVEGAEINVIRGAARSLAEADKAIISIEAHRQVFGRTGIDPIVVLREIAAIRPFQFLVSETGATSLDLSRPFFDQQSDDRHVYNIVCTSV